MANRIKNENYYVVQGWMIKNLKLKGLQLNIYAIIYGFSQLDGQRFTGSLNYLADWNGCSRQAVINALKKLTENGLIEKIDNIINGVKFCEYYATNFTGSQETLLGVHKVDGGSQESLLGGGQETLPNNIYLNNIDNNIVKKESKEKSSSCDAEKSAVKTENPLGNSFSENLNETVKDWIQYKKEKNQNYKPTGLKALLNKIKEQVTQIGEQSVIDSIYSSMASNYQGITYRVKQNNKNSNLPNNQKTVNGGTYDYDRQKNSALFD